MPSRSPFTAPNLLAELYGTPQRLAQRTGALHRAKIKGRYVPDVIADIATKLPSAGVIADIGCGRGASTNALATRLPDARILAVDAAPSMLQTTRTRLARRAERVQLLQADFHRLPLAAHRCDLIVAAFCLYHSNRPTSVLAEISRCLKPGGTAILVTKSADSYRELDRLVTRSGLDPYADRRPSLYQTAHSANLPLLAADAMTVQTVDHEEHLFRFTDSDHLAEYLITVPKYQLPDRLRQRPDRLAAALRHRVGDGPFTASSTVTYFTARRPEQS